MPDPESLLERLIRGRVDFVIVGGFAAVAHGASLVTQDIDICCDFAAKNILRLQAALADLHPVHRMTPKRLSLQLTKESYRGLKNLYLETDLGQLDCLGEILGVGTYNEAKKRSVTINLAGGRCRVLNIEALIESKEAMGRPRDREAIVQLNAIKERKKP